MPSKAPDVARAPADTAAALRQAGRAPGGPAPGPRTLTSAGLTVILVGVLLPMIDFFIVNVALPSIKVRLHAGPGALEWIVAGYGLSFGAFLVAAGRIGDRIGRRRAFSCGVAVFVATSTACGLAPTVGVLDVARLAQGAGAALISANVLSTIGVLYLGQDRVRAITVYGMVMGVAATGGQLVGGLLMGADVAGMGWRAIFLINVPVGLAALGLASRTVPESGSPTPRGVDTVGMLGVTAATAALVLPLVEGRQMGWPAWSWACLGAAPVILGGLAAHQRWMARRGGSPLLEPALFRIASLRVGLCTQAAFWCGQAAVFLVLALYLQDGRGLGPLGAGGVFTILAVGYLATSLRAPSLTVRFGRDVITAGAATAAIGDLLLLVAAGAHTPLGLLTPGLALVGAGQGLCITPLTATLLANIDSGRAGTVSGVLSTMQQVGNAIGVAITGAVFFGTLKGGYPRAFRYSLAELAGLLVGVALLSRLLPASFPTARQ